MAAWYPLFSISVEHLFFPGGRCRDLAWTPTGATARLLQQAGLLLRRTDDGLVVLASNEGMDSLRMHVADAADRLPLVFTLHSTDPHFAGVTLPAAAPGQVLFVDSESAQCDAQGRRLLHTGAYVDAGALMSAAAAPLAGLLDGPAALHPGVAVVRIMLGNGAGGLCSDGLDPALRDFWLRFDAGHSYWKYYLMGELGQRPALIVDLDQAVGFRPQGSVDLPGQRRAAVFLSDRAIPLRSLPDQRFQLKEQASFGEKILIRRMPNARPGLRRREVVDGHAVLVSEIFINQ